MVVLCLGLPTHLRSCCLGVWWPLCPPKCTNVLCFAPSWTFFAVLLSIQPRGIPHPVLFTGITADPFTWKNPFSDVHEAVPKHWHCQKSWCMTMTLTLMVISPVIVVDYRPLPILTSPLSLICFRQSLQFLYAAFLTIIEQCRFQFRFIQLLQTQWWSAWGWLGFRWCLISLRLTVPWVTGLILSFARHPNYACLLRSSRSTVAGLSIIKLFADLWVRWAPQEPFLKMQIPRWHITFQCSRVTCSLKSVVLASF